MRSKTCTILISLLLMTGCDDRVHITEIECGSSPCLGRWDGTDLWSPVYQSNEIDGMPEIDESSLWKCEPNPDIDICVEVDSSGHVGCFRDEGGWFVAVAPTCAVQMLPEWIDVGAGMSARAYAN